MKVIIRRWQLVFLGAVAISIFLSGYSKADSQSFNTVEFPLLLEAKKLFSQQEFNEIGKLALKAVEKYAGSPEAVALSYYFMGCSLKELGEYDKAIEALQRTWEFYPDTTEYRWMTWCSRFNKIDKENEL